MKNRLLIMIVSLGILASCSGESHVYNTSNHGYRHGRETRYYREYRGYAHRGDFNKGYNASGWESR